MRSDERIELAPQVVVAAARSVEICTPLARLARECRVEDACDLSLAVRIHCLSIQRDFAIEFRRVQQTAEKATRSTNRHEPDAKFEPFRVTSWIVPLL